MINLDTYTANSIPMTESHVSGYPPVFPKENDPDAAAAANFERILNNPPTSPPESSAVKTETTETNHSSIIDFLKTIIDIFNPLQHIPVIGALYRHITGDEINSVARLAGDTIYGGPLGSAVAVADIVCEKTTGKDIGETLIAGIINNGPQPETKIVWKTNEPETITANEIIWSTASQTQDFPEKNSPVPPEIIASKMMEALDKYAQMNLHEPPEPQISEVY